MTRCERQGHVRPGRRTRRAPGSPSSGAARWPPAPGVSRPAARIAAATGASLMASGRVPAMRRTSGEHVLTLLYAERAGSSTRRSVLAQVCRRLTCAADRPPGADQAQQRGRRGSATAATSSRESFSSPSWKRWTRAHTSPGTVMPSAQQERDVAHLRPRVDHDRRSVAGDELPHRDRPEGEDRSRAEGVHPGREQVVQHFQQGVVADLPGGDQLRHVADALQIALRPPGALPQQPLDVDEALLGDGGDQIRSGCARRRGVCASPSSRSSTRQCRPRRVTQPHQRGQAGRTARCRPARPCRPHCGAAGWRWRWQANSKILNRARGPGCGCGCGPGSAPRRRAGSRQTAARPPIAGCHCRGPSPSMTPTATSVRVLALGHGVMLADPPGTPR